MVGNLGKAGDRHPPAIPTREPLTAHLARRHPFLPSITLTSQLSINSYNTLQSMRRLRAAPILDWSTVALLACLPHATSFEHAPGHVRAPSSPFPGGCGGRSGHRRASACARPCLAGRGAGMQRSSVSPRSVSASSPPMHLLPRTGRGGAEEGLSRDQAKTERVARAIWPLQQAGIL